MSQVSALDLWGHKRWLEDFCQHSKELWAVKSRSVKRACFVQTQLVSLFFVSSPCCNPAAFLNQFLGALGMCSGFRDFSRRVHFKKNCLLAQHCVPPHHTPTPLPVKVVALLLKMGFRQNLVWGKVCAAFICCVESTCPVALALAWPSFCSDFFVR